MRTKEQKTNELDPAAALESAQRELETIEAELASIDVSAGTINDVVRRKRELEEKADIARDRLAIARQRHDAAQFAECEHRLSELERQLVEAESALEAERQKSRAALASLLDPAWLECVGRFASAPPAWTGIVDHAITVIQATEKVEAIRSETRAILNRISDRRAQQDRERSRMIFDGLRRLIEGGSANVDLQAYRVEIPVGFASDTARAFRSKSIPTSVADGEGAVFVLVPRGTNPLAYAGACSLLARPTPIDADDLPDQLRDILLRALAC